MDEKPKTGNKRAKLRVGMRDIALLAGVHYRTALKAEEAGEFVYLNLWSVVKWIYERRQG